MRTKLEKLVERTQLVAPIQYENPQRKEEIFCDFCKQYADTIGMTIVEEKFGYLEDKKKKINDILDAIERSEFNNHNWQDLVLLLGTPLDPITLPIIGMIGECRTKGNLIRILLPEYKSLLDIGSSLKAHEYMHAYGRIVARTLLKQGLINLNSYHCDVEPGYKVPTSEELKEYERQFLKMMIQKEKERLL